MNIPTSYQPGYEQARLIDEELAKTYIEHLVIGDPLADAAVKSLAGVDQQEKHRLIKACMEEDESGMREAPDALRELFDQLSRSSIEFDREKALLGSRMFHKFPGLFQLATALHGVLISTEGSAQSFYITGRITSNTRRLRQNGRHVLEVTLPGSLARCGEGWKLTVRIRIIHAEVRRLLIESDDWDFKAEGTPVNSAHISLGAVGLSETVMFIARELGASISEEESDGYMEIWKYVGWLMGVPDVFMPYLEKEDSARHFREVAHTCDRLPGEKSSELVNGIIKAVPDVAGIDDPSEKEKVTSLISRVSRVLLGDRARGMNFPKQSTFGVLPALRMQLKLKMLSSKLLPSGKSFVADGFAEALKQSVYDAAGISYRLPDAVKDVDSKPW